ncbi:hypothetical protein [Pelagibacterium sp. H642]|uniref:hypothetical protein n=1 Tax=Pelagibacterium sp. H642 TaxID=1881069 RepID=UPI002814FA96|nr:hypothetical protein [Pelagibacterium sp. H642]WMT92006.1 hypothetical protein NO934_07045 [Pelagibacterium sp. H642]
MVRSKLFSLVLGASLAGSTAYAQNATAWMEATEALGEISALESAAAAFEAGPVAITDALEREPGGRSACQRYTTAMIAAGFEARLADQLRLVLGGGDADAEIIEAPSQPERQDGSVWFPLAEQAGFFAGCVAAAIAQASDGERAIAALTERLEIELPLPNDGVDIWLAQQIRSLGDGMSGPVAQWFDAGFTQAARL